MSQIANNVTAAKPSVGGAVYVAPAGTTLPTSASSTLSEEYKSLGYISEDGITNSNSPQTDFIKAFGGDKVLPITDEREDTFQFKLIEAFNTDVLKQVYGSANVTTTEDEITVKVNNSELPAYVYVIDLIMRDDRVKRIVLPVGYVSELGDITYSDSDAIGYDVTITAQSDSSGNTHYEYTTIKK